MPLNYNNLNTIINSIVTIVNHSSNKGIQWCLYWLIEKTVSLAVLRYIISYVPDICSFSLSFSCYPNNLN